jgi:hypothetical protein
MPIRPLIATLAVIVFSLATLGAVPAQAQVADNPCRWDEYMANGVCVQRSPEFVAAYQCVPRFGGFDLGLPQRSKVEIGRLCGQNGRRMYAHVFRGKKFLYTVKLGIVRGNDSNSMMRANVQLFTKPRRLNTAYSLRITFSANYKKRGKAWVRHIQVAR